MRRVSFAVVALTAIALSGCTSEPAPAPSQSFAAVDYSQWSGGRSTPAVEPIYPKVGNPAVDVLHYGLDLTWDRTTRTLNGQATIRARAVSGLTDIKLDFMSPYTVDGTTVDGKKATGTVADGKFTVPAAVKADQNVTLVVNYHGTPSTVPMPSERGDVEPLGLTVNSDGTLWTMQEPYGAATWYPANDLPSDKALYDIAVTVPAGWSGIASGTPNGQTGNTFRYTSKDPVASYLTTIAVGPYQREEVAGPHGLPIVYWYEPGKGEQILEAARRSPKHLAWLEQRFGPYPFPSAGVVLVASRSAMETQQMITLGYQIEREDENLADSVEADVLHEYSHHWFGNAVTPSQWRDLWLSEGFATYAQVLFESERTGVSLTRWETWAVTQDGKLRAKLGPPGSPSGEHFAESNVYLCPALMLRQIHKLLGDDAFFALARDWAQRNRSTTQDRATFTAFVNQHTGKDLTSLINNWLDSPTTPQ